MNTVIEEASSSSHSKGNSVAVQQRSRQRSESQGRHRQEDLGLPPAPAKSQKEKPRTDSEGSGNRSSKSISLYQMYNTQIVALKKNLNAETQSATQKVKKRIQEKLRISSSISCSQRDRPRHKVGEHGDQDAAAAQLGSKNISLLSAKDSKDDLLDSPHLGLSEYDFKDI